MAVPNMRIFTVAAHAYMAQAWESVYTAGQTDTAGNYMGGSELLHFESHGGSLFTAIGYWEDSRNCLYPSANYLTCGGSPWGQILRLDEPGGQWVQDLHMDSWFVRAEALKSLAFSTDASGTALSGGPVRLLVAGAGVGGFFLRLPAGSVTTAPWHGHSRIFLRAKSAAGASARSPCTGTARRALTALLSLWALAVLSVDP